MMMHMHWFTPSFLLAVVKPRAALVLKRKEAKKVSYFTTYTAPSTVVVPLFGGATLFLQTLSL